MQNDSVHRSSARTLSDSVFPHLHNTLLPYHRTRNMSVTGEAFR